MKNSFMLYDLNEGWAIATIDEVINYDGLFVDGDWIETKDQNPNGEIRLIQLADIGDGRFKNRSSKYLDRETTTRLNCTFLNKNDVLVARMPEPLGRACLFPLKGENKYITAVDVAIIRPGVQSVHPEYLMWLLNSKPIRQIIQSLQTGTTRKRVSRSNLATVNIPVPPLVEQHRIVEKIEVLFSELDNGVEQLKTIQQQLKIYRQAVLKAAFEGKLTAEWRTQQKDLQTAHSLLEQKRKQRVGTQVAQPANYNDASLPNSNLPGGWCWTRLMDISTKITDGEHFRPQTEMEGVYFLSAKDIKEDGPSFDDPLYISHETARKALLRCNPERNDILIVSRGATIGRLCVVNTDKVFCLLGSVILIKPRKEINSLFLSYMLKSSIFNHELIAVSGSTAQQAIYLRDIKSIFICCCSLQEQQAIVQEIESRLSIADKLEETIEQSLKQAEALRQSILKKAFEGRLVSEEELAEIRSDPEWEPAIVLLERIKAERAARQNTENKNKRGTKKR